MAGGQPASVAPTGAQEEGAGGPLGSQASPGTAPPSSFAATVIRLIESEVQPCVQIPWSLEPQFPCLHSGKNTSSCSAGIIIGRRDRAAEEGSRTEGSGLAPALLSHGAPGLLIACSLHFPVCKMGLHVQGGGEDGREEV